MHCTNQLSYEQKATKALINLGALQNKEEEIMDLRKCLLTKNECYQVGKKITPTGIMWHSTGANNPNLGR